MNGGASVQSTGSAGEFDISMGANIDNKLYFGFTFGIQNIYQKKSIYYGEGYNYAGGNGYNTDQGGQIAVDANGIPLTSVMQSMGMTQTTTVDGAGVNFKAGVVYSPIPSLRLGMAIHTPTFYSLERRYSMSFSTASIGPHLRDGPAAARLHLGHEFRDPRRQGGHGLGVRLPDTPDVRRLVHLSGRWRSSRSTTNATGTTASA